MVDHGGGRQPLLFYVGSRNTGGPTSNHCLDMGHKAQHPDGMKHSTTLLRLQPMTQTFTSSIIQLRVLRQLKTSQTTTTRTTTTTTGTTTTTTGTTTTMKTTTSAPMITTQMSTATTQFQ